jgi:glycosyltransferase involved in cell wall biosynthesis
MRILHIVTAFPARRDDVIAPWLVELIQQLRARGHEVEVFTAAYRGLGDHVYEGIPVYRFRYCLARWENLTHEEAAPDRMRRSLLYRLLPIGFVAAGMLAIWRHCRRRRYDVVHVHWPLPLALFGWAAQRARPAPLATTFYGVELRLAKHSWRVFQRFLAWAARRSDLVVAISSYTARELRELVDVPVEVIPYTTPLPQVDAGAAHAPGGPVLFVGRLVERKGVALLVEALTLLDRPGLLLEIVGEGPERSRLEALARTQGVADRVIFRGRVSSEELQASYARAAVCVLPAIYDSRGDTEGLGVVLLEAMNHGTPVIASRVGGIVDIVEDGSSGLLVPPNDSRALAQALQRVLDDPHLAQRLGDAGRRRLHERFSWEAITDRWERAYPRRAPTPSTPIERSRPIPLR